MLSQILDYIHNYFIKEVYRGHFAIIDGEIQTDLLLEGQYFYIKGSVFNDGLNQYFTNELTDEEFDGELWALAIPKDVIAISEEVTAWVAKYGEVMNSPYNSESFGGYSYTKSAGGSDGKSNNASWQSVFGSRLNAYRKIS